MTLALTAGQGYALVACGVRPLAWDIARSDVGGGLTMAYPSVSDRLPATTRRLGARELKEIPWGRIEAAALAAVRGQLGWVPGPREALRSQRPHRGRPPLDPSRLVEVAAYYVSRCSAGSNRPTADTAEKFDTTAGYVNGILDRAQKRGYFERRGGPGRSGGRLTRSGMAVLQRRGASVGE